LFCFWQITIVSFNHARGVHGRGIFGNPKQKPIYLGGEQSREEQGRGRID
jgi:hypothetical protein